MSSRPSPNTLKKISTRKIAKTIESNFCRYMSKMENIVERNRHIEELQHFLIEYLPLEVLHSVFQQTLHVFGTHNLGYRKYTKVLKLIFLLFMHGNTRYFTPRSNLLLPRDEHFWLNKVSFLQNIVVLDLNNVCTDNILQVVGNQCPSLQAINIAARISAVQEEFGYGVRYDVTDTGLKYLHKCRKLRHIILDDGPLRNRDYRIIPYRVTQNGILELLRSLPELRYINYVAMGTVVNELKKCSEESPSPPLSLLDIEDDDCKPEHIRSISAICPGLKSLQLIQEGHDQLVDHELAEETAFELCESSLQLQMLCLRRWPFTNNFHRFIALKGNHLQRLDISTNSNNALTSNDLVLIGKCCPQIECLYVSPVNEHHSDLSNLQLAKKRKFMGSLVSFTLEGGNWQPQICFELCLQHATALKELSLSRDSNINIILDEHFRKLRKYNKLLMLRKMILGPGVLVQKLAFLG